MSQKEALYEHIRALRRVLVVSAAAVGVLFVLFFYLLNRLYRVPHTPFHTEGQLLSNQHSYQAIPLLTYNYRHKLFYLSIFP